MCKLNFVFTSTKKLFTYAFIFPIVFVMVLGVGGLGFPNTTEAQVCTGAGGQVIAGVTTELECRETVGATWTPGPGEGTVGNPTSETGILEAATAGIVSTVLPSIESGLAFVMTLVLQFVGLLTGLAGIVLNGVVYYTIVQMAVNYDNISAIQEGWGVIRDLANMGFIFILLYAAIMTILGLGKDNQKLIVKVVVIAILINFSLFLTSLIIDASNILALFFYDAIAPGATSGNLDWKLTGLSNAFMQHLNLTSLYQATEQGISTDQIITVGIMGSIFLLVAAFVFFAVALMLIIRYVTLIMVLILSPIAFMAMVLPQLNKHADRWWEALSGQAFFAPIYFVLTYVTLRVLAGVTGTLQNSFGGVGTAGENLGSLSQIGALGAGVANNTLAMIINFIVIIAFLITSLVIAKEWANKAGGGMGKLTGWASGAAGGATLGAVGWAGRNTVGRAGVALGDNERLKQAAASGSATARLALATGRKIGEKSFDTRSSGLGGTLDAGKGGGKGGFADYKKKKVEAEEKFAKSLGPSARTIALAKADREYVKNTFGENSPEYRDAIQKVDDLEGVDKKEAEKREKETIKNDPLIKTKEEIGIIQRNINRKEEDYKSELTKRQREIELVRIPELKNQKEQELETFKTTSEKELAEMGKNLTSLKRMSEDRTDEIKKNFRNSDGELKTTDSRGDVLKKDFAKSVESSIYAKIRGYNYDAAAKIRKGKKSAKDLIDEALKDTGEKSEGEKPETPPAGGGNPTP